MFNSSKFKNAVAKPFGKAGVLSLPSSSTHGSLNSDTTIVKASPWMILVNGESGKGTLTAHSMWSWSKENGRNVRGVATNESHSVVIPAGSGGADIVDFDVEAGTGLVLAGLDDGTVNVCRGVHGGDPLAAGAADAAAHAEAFSSYTSELVASDAGTNRGGRRVHSVQWSPVASSLAAVGSASGVAEVLDCGAGGSIASAWRSSERDGGVQKVEWSRCGKTLLLTSKGGGAVCVADPRAPSVVAEWGAHGGAQGVRATHLERGSGRIVTTGFSKFRNREVKVWDLRDTSKPLHAAAGESSSAAVEPLYDPDTELLFLAGRADTTVRIVCVRDKAPFLQDASTYMSPAPQRDVALLPKVNLDVMDCEVGRLLCATASAIEPVSIHVPRKVKREWADVEELFPQTATGEAALDAEAWLGGADALPVTRSLQPRAAPAASESSGGAAAADAAAPAAPASAVPARLTAEALRSTGGGSSSSSSSSSAAAGGSVGRASIVSNSSARSAALNLVRASKYRNNFPGTVKPELHYYELKPDLQVYPESDSIALSCDATHFAVPWNGSGGLVGVSPLGKVGRWLAENTITYETGLGHIADLAFSPFDPSTLALGSDTGTVAVITLDLGSGACTSRQDLIGHEARISRTVWHPSVRGLLATASGDPYLRLWDVNAGAELAALQHPEEFVFDAAWSHDGTRVVTTSRDTIVRVWDPRADAAKPAVETKGHDGNRTTRVVWLGEGDKFATTGFSRGSERQIALHDARAPGAPYATINVDVNSGPLMPFYDEDTRLLYVSGKGSGWIRSYELVDEKPFAHQISDHSAPSANSGLCAFPKRALDAARVEVARFLRLSKDRVEPVSFYTPRTRKEYFQDDIYCDTRAAEPACGSAREFWDAPSSKTFPCKTVPVDRKGMEPLSTAPPPPQVASSLDKFGKDMRADAANASAEQLFDSFVDKIQGAANDTAENPSDAVDDDEWDD